MYYLYHIPGKKIGVTRNLNNRVTEQQGYAPGEYEVLFTSTDIDYISNKEIELQQSYGYKKDRTLYKNLFKSNMKINPTEQTSTFPEHIPWIMQNAKTSMFNNDRSYIYNKAFYEAFFNPKHNPKEKCISNNTGCERFDLIRNWAAVRGIYDEGNTIVQYTKLQEEAGELAKALLNNDHDEINDAIGDMVVVLTNLAHLHGTEIEDCIDSAYTEIAGRTGKMINGTFVKDE